MTYDPTAFKDWVTSTYGADVLNNLTFTDEELTAIDALAIDGGINIWAASSSAG